MFSIYLVKAGFYKGTIIIVHKHKTTELNHIAYIPKRSLWCGGCGAPVPNHILLQCKLLAAG